MATIHGKSGSTQYLLKGMKPINGKYFSTLAEMQHFYTHYEEILAETETTAAENRMRKSSPSAKKQPSWIRNYGKVLLGRRLTWTKTSKS